MPAKEINTTWGNQIIADDTVRYKINDVVGYTQGVYNIKKITSNSFIGNFSFFAQQTDSGRINRYTAAKNYYYQHDLHWIVQMRSPNYIQSGTSSPPVTLNYRHLASMIPAQHPANMLLDNYKKQRTLSVAFRITGDILIAGSFLNLFVKERQYRENNTNSKLPESIMITYTMGMGAGVLSASVGMWKGVRTKRRLFEVVRMYNWGR